MVRLSEVQPSVSDTLNVSAQSTVTQVPIHQSRLAEYVKTVREAFGKEMTARTNAGAGRSLTERMYMENAAAAADKREWDTPFVSDSTRRKASNLPDISLFSPWTPDGDDASKCSWFVRRNYRAAGSPVSGASWQDYTNESDIVDMVAANPSFSGEELAVVVDKNSSRFIVIVPEIADPAAAAPSAPEGAFDTLSRRQLDGEFEPFSGSGVQWLSRDGYEVQGRLVQDWTAYPAVSDALRSCVTMGGDAVLQRKGTNTYKLLKLDPTGREGATRVNANTIAFLAISEDIDPYEVGMEGNQTFAPISVIRGSSFVEGALKAVHTLRTAPYAPEQTYKPSNPDDRIWSKSDAMLSGSSAAVSSATGAKFFFMRGRSNNMNNLIFELTFSREELMDGKKVLQRIQTAFQKHGIRDVRLYDYTYWYRNFAMYNLSSTDYSFGWSMRALDYLGMEGSWQMRNANPRYADTRPAYHSQLRRRWWQWSWWNASWVGVSRGWYTGRYGNYWWYGSYRNKQYRYATNYKWDRLSFAEVTRPKDIVDFFNRSFSGILKASVVSEKYVDEKPPRGFPSGYAGSGKYRRRWTGSIRIENVSRNEVGVYMYGGWKLVDMNKRSGADLARWRWYWGSNRWNSHPEVLIGPGRHAIVSNLDIAEFDGPDDFLITDFRIPDLSAWCAERDIPTSEVAQYRRTLEDMFMNMLRDLHLESSKEKNREPNLRIEGFKSGSSSAREGESIDTALGWSSSQPVDVSSDQAAAINKSYVDYLDYRYSVDSIDEKNTWHRWITKDAELTQRMIDARWSLAMASTFTAFTVFYVMYSVFRFRYREYVFGALAFAAFVYFLTNAYRSVYSNAWHTHWDQPKQKSEDNEVDNEVVNIPHSLPRT